jgi:hypothetical protein
MPAYFDKTSACREGLLIFAALVQVMGLEHSGSVEVGEDTGTDWVGRYLPRTFPLVRRLPMNGAVSGSGAAAGQSAETGRPPLRLSRLLRQIRVSGADFKLLASRLRIQADLEA